MTGTRARSHDETVDALAAEGLPALQDTLTGLAPQEVFHLIDPGGAPTSHSGPPWLRRFRELTLGVRVVRFQTLSRRSASPGGDDRHEQAVRRTGYGTRIAKDHAGARQIGGLAALTLAAVLALAACGGAKGAGDPAAASATAGPKTKDRLTSKPPVRTQPAGKRIPVLSGGKASKSDIRWVQRRLGRVHPDLKKLVGKVDGRTGPQTRQALCVYRTIMQGLPSSLWKPISKADLTSLAKIKTLPAFAFHKQTHAWTVAWVSKACQAVLEVMHGRYRHIMPATTGKPGHETPSGLHRIEWRWPGWHVSTKYRENGEMLDSQYFGPGIALHGVPSNEVHKEPSSHGCVRLYPSDARTLYRDLRVGIPVWATGRFHFPS